VSVSAKRRRRDTVPKVDHHLWWRSAQSCALALLLVFAAGVATQHRVSLALIILVGAVAVGTVSLTVAAATGSDSLALTWLTFAGSLGALGWVVWTHLEHGPWHEQPVVALLLAGVIGTPLSALALAHFRAERDEAQRLRDLAAQKAILAHWRDTLGSVGVHGVTVQRVVETRSGKAVVLRLPRNGSVTLATLRDASTKIAIALELRDPDWVRFDIGKHAAEVIMHVTERDVFAEQVPYPGLLTPISINDPFDVGVSDDGTLALLTLREVCVLIVGIRGSGKTNLLNVIIAQLSRCVDAIVFGIDLKGGRLLAPWVRPWAQGRTARPVIDWIATDRDEADKLLNGLISVIQSRAKFHAGRGDKIVPSTDWPAYVLVVDEIGELFNTAEPKAYRDARSPGAPSPGSLGWLGTRIANTGRGEAVDAVLGALRSTVTNLPSDIKAQCEVRIGLKVSTLAEAQNLIPDEAGVAKLMAKVKHAGTSIFWRKGRPPRADKLYRLETSDVDHIAVETGDNIRPGPNKHDAAALGANYASRWARARTLLDTWIDSDTAVATAGPADFESIIADVPDPEAGHSAARKRAVEIVAKAGTLGINPGMITSKLNAEGFGTTRYTVQRWLADDERLERIKHGRWRLARDKRTT
jgi:S-DNA-T family DNA segregation ATPase FtsK/SpoIIIE